MAKSPPLIIEQVSKSVRFPATFYCQMGCTLDGHLSFERTETPAPFPQPGILASPQDSPLFDVQTMPETVGPHWLHVRFSDHVDNLRRYAPNLRLVKDHVVDHLPDFFGWPPFGIVSDRARHLLEEIDPDGSIFFDVEITTSTGAPVPGPYFYWLQRNVMVMYPDRATRPLKRQTLPFPGHFTIPNIAWQLAHNDALRQYLQNIPFWCLNLRFMMPAFNAPCFTQLKSAGLTGLVENTAEFAGDRKLYESIGHIA